MSTQSRSEKAGRFVVPEKLPHAWFIFDERGESWGDISNGAIMVKKGDQHDDIMEFAGKLGTVQSLQYNTMIKDIDEQMAVKTFRGEGYVVVPVDKRDWLELQTELDKLETIR